VKFAEAIQEALDYSDVKDLGQGVEGELVLEILEKRLQDPDTRREVLWQCGERFTFMNNDLNSADVELVFTCLLIVLKGGESPDVEAG
jgi:hypothetical protein